MLKEILDSRKVPSLKSKEEMMEILQREEYGKDRYSGLLRRKSYS